MPPLFPAQGASSSGNLLLGTTCRRRRLAERIPEPKKPVPALAAAVRNVTHDAREAFAQPARWDRCAVSILHLGHSMKLHFQPHSNSMRARIATIVSPRPRESAFRRLSRRHQ